MCDLDRDDICERFLDSVPFELYPFQEEAVLTWFECEGGVLVSAPTGMGKTLIAETAIFEALWSQRRVYYTTPLIALTDQKFRELQDRVESWGYSREDVGLITGNRKVNPDAPVQVVVAEILLNHLLSPDESFDDVSAVVMDEFHYFNDPERGIVWELSLVLLPSHVRLLLLSATVGNAVDFVVWLDKKHDRRVRLVQTQERRVPLEYCWVEDRILTDQLVKMASGGDAERRTPALVFCFSRDECWEMAERLKGLPLIDKETRTEIEAVLEGVDFKSGIGPKLKTMLIRGVGVHHAGILPRYKEIVEDLFTRKLVPFVVCTETLAAGINLPARAVVLKSILKGKPGSRKLLPSASAHQMFGRAGRPQFDSNGYVYVLAHEDDVKIYKWRQKYDQIDARSKDPNIIRARKQLEKKKPSRRKTQEYWSEGQFQSLIKAGPANLASRSMIPYRFLIFLLTHHADLKRVREFLQNRFHTQKKLEAFQSQLNHMLENLQSLHYLEYEAVDDFVRVDDSIHDLVGFRSIDPLYGSFLTEQLARASLEEKLMVLESMLEVPWVVARSAPIPEDLPKGPLQSEVMEPLMVAMGIVLTRPEPPPPEEREFNPWAEDEEEEPPPTFPEMLRIAFEDKLPTPADIFVQTKWVAGGVFDSEGDFHRFVASRSLAKVEGLVMRHLLRLVLLAAEFHDKTGDPDYEIIAERATSVCERVDEAYTKRFLSQESEKSELLAE